MKTDRLEELKMADETFAPRQVPVPDLSNKRVFPAHVRVKVLFEPEAKWRLIEEFGRGCYTPQEDGRLLFQWDYTDEDSMLGWLLTFGDKAQVLEPETVKEKLLSTAKRLLARYESEKQ